MTSLIEARQWLFFDLGSTLVDEDDYLRRRDRLLYELIASASGRLDADVYRQTLQTIKASLPQSVAKAVLRQFVPDAETQDRLYRLYKQRLSAVAATSRRLYGDVLPVLPALARAINLGIIADQDDWVREALDAQWHIAAYFKVVVLSGEVGWRKPDRRLFEMALSRANCQPERAIMLGDRPDKDIAPAKRLGMTTIRIRRGLDFGSNQPRDALEEADFEIKDLSQLFSLDI